jgi:hypothetical protein
MRISRRRFLYYSTLVISSVALTAIPLYAYDPTGSSGNRDEVRRSYSQAVLLLEFHTDPGRMHRHVIKHPTSIGGGCNPWATGTLSGMSVTPHFSL